MTQPVRIHAGKTPVRIHYIREWAQKRGLKQRDIVRELGVDKSSVSRWFKGTLPTEPSLISLAALFETDVPGLFRHPGDDWLARFFRERSEQDKEKAIQLLDVAFGSTGTRG